MLKFEVLLFLYLIPVVFTGEVNFPPRLVTRLIHFNSIQSPFYPKHTNDSVAEIDLHVLLSRVFLGTMSAPVSPLHTSGFLAHLKVGQQRVDQYLFLDTGSSLLWIHCQPVMNGKNPDYDSRKSSTYRSEHCLTSDFCQAHDYKCDRSLRCEYVLRYADEFQSKGHLARETFVFRGTGGSLFGRDEVILDNILFGCSKETTLLSDGILGLGNKKYSLLAQTSSSRFSYCLGYITDLSYDHNRLIIGNPIKTGLTHEIPLFVDEHYYIDITAIEIGGVILDVDVNILKRNVQKGSGGMAIDTGSTFSYFPRLAFTPFATAIKDLIDRRSLRRYPDYRSRLCYNGRFGKELAGFPLVRFWFGRFAYMEFGTGSLFSQVTDGYFCLAFKPIEEVNKYMDFGILGILLQQGYYISYNLQASAPTFSFEKMDCSDLEYDIHDEL